MTPLQTMAGGLSNQANISIGEEVEISCKLVQGHSENKKEQKLQCSSSPKLEDTRRWNKTNEYRYQWKGDIETYE